MRRVLFAFLLVGFGAFIAGPAEAAGAVVAKISLSQQTMQVYVNGLRRYSWAVSTARRGYRTPTGNYKPIRMHKTYFSRKYDNSPMPYSIFFYGGYASHGTNYVKSLGRPASHGCVRLHTSNAAALYNLVRQHGPSNTKIVITN
jgi:lipoprotein-anchoring transpeptidase ErfK/SrfK